MADMNPLKERFGRHGKGSAAVFQYDVQTNDRQQMVDVTAHVEDALKRVNAADGVAVVYVPHTTAGVTIQENADPAVKTDVLAKLDQMIPKGEAMYTHAEGNSDAHLKTMLVGTSANILIDQRRLVLGQWQGVYLCEFDGPRERDLLVKIVKLDPTEID